MVADTTADAGKRGAVLSALATPVDWILGRIFGMLYRRRYYHFRRYCARLPAQVASPLYVCVGANDGATGDPLGDLVRGDRRWRALLVEPVPDCFERLKARCAGEERFLLDRVAVGRPPGRATFYAVDPAARRAMPDLPDWYDQLGSFTREHIGRHLEGRLEPFIREIEVEVCGLSDLLDRRGLGAPDLLQIDTEGHEAAVLQTLDFGRHAPRAMHVEHRHLPADVRRDLFRRLQGLGYRVRFCGCDFIAVRRGRRARPAVAG